MGYAVVVRPNGCKVDVVKGLVSRIDIAESKEGALLPETALTDSIREIRTPC